jgi:hypothetical protein
MLTYNRERARVCARSRAHTHTLSQRERERETQVILIDLHWGRGRAPCEGHGTIFYFLFFYIPHTGDINRPSLGVRDTMRRSRNKIFVRIRWLLLALPRGLSLSLAPPSPPPPSLARVCARFLPRSHTCVPSLGDGVPGRFPYERRRTHRWGGGGCICTCTCMCNACPCVSLCHTHTDLCHTHTDV